MEREDSVLTALELQQFKCEIQQPTFLLTLLQQICEGLSKPDLSPTPLPLSDLSLLGTLGNGKKDENKYLIHPFCTEGFLRRESNRRKNRILHVACCETSGDT